MAEGQIVVGRGHSAACVREFAVAEKPPGAGTPPWWQRVAAGEAA